MIQSFGIHVDDITVVDEMFDHAQLHAEEYVEDFLVFLSKHYGELKAALKRQHQENGEGQELPFKHTCHMTSLSPFVLKWDHGL